MGFYSLMTCVSVCVQDEILGDNMKMEVTGKLQTHFNTAAKHSNTTAGVSVIMVRTQTPASHLFFCPSAVYLPPSQRRTFIS